MCALVRSGQTGPGAGPGAGTVGRAPWAAGRGRCRAAPGGAGPWRSQPGGRRRAVAAGRSPPGARRRSQLSGCGVDIKTYAKLTESIILTRSRFRGVDFFASQASGVDF